MATTMIKPIEKLLDAFRTLQGVTKEEKQGNAALIATLKEMENTYADQIIQNMPDYNSQLPSTLGATPKVYQEKSQDELYEIAEASANESITEKINKLNETADKKLSDLNKKLFLKNEELNADTVNAEKKYEKDNIKALNNAARKGIAYSSIYENTAGGIYGEYVNELTKARSEFDLISAEIDRELTFLVSSKENALLEYDLERAANLEKQLNKLKTDQQSAIAAVNKYNKQIADAEIKFQLDRAKNLEKLQNDWKTAQSKQLQNEKEQGFTGQNLEKMNVRYDMAKNFYFSVTKANAKHLIEENASSLIDVLGKVYYNKLLAENNNR